jgi:putative membrane-bound dehydrogenase-like protein
MKNAFLLSTVGPVLVFFGSAHGGEPSASEVKDVRAPEGFRVTMFAEPPEVNYPVCLTSAVTGEVFVGVDPQGSLGKKPGEGKILRCIDTDGDGKADRINEFAKVDHPRGLVYDNGSLWVLHPPTLSVFHDDDGDGRSDRQETLVTGISTDYVNKRGADHTTNGIQMGIDGWIYIAVGDFGFTQAKGTDGTTLSRRGGGVARVRPDGTELEIYCWGLRNIVDVAIDPYLGVFTRDNTNDGGGWDTRVSHIMQTGHYGYPSLFKNFTEEIMPPLASYGGGSGCGAMYLDDASWPAPYGNALYTCDWGRNEIYRHNLPAHGPTFDPHQETFLKITRPTDMDIDGAGRMAVSSWKGGKFNYSGPDVGYVAMVTPPGFTPREVPDLARLNDELLSRQIASDSATIRLHAQREFLRRGTSKTRTELLTSLIADKSVPLAGRVAAIFTLKQLDGAAATNTLIQSATDDAIREFCVRAVTDRKSESVNLKPEVFAAWLEDPNPRVRAQAAISTGRTGNLDLARLLLPLTSRPDGSSFPTETPTWNQPDPDRVIPHLAVQALVALDASEACLEALDGPHARGALWALKYMHTEEAVSGLLRRLSTTYDKALRREILTTLIRLYHQEGPFEQGWWGTRPDTSGPYFDRQTWSQSERIADAIRTAYAEADEETAKHISAELARHKVKIDGLSDAAAEAAEAGANQAIKLPQADADNPDQIANMDEAEVLAKVKRIPGDAARGKPLFVSQSCIACHTYRNGQSPKGPHLVDIGKRYNREELLQSTLKPSAKIAQGFDTVAFLLFDGKVVTGFVVSESADEVVLRESNGVVRTIAQDDIEERSEQKISSMPTGLVGNLTLEQLADLMAYLESLE